MSIRPPLESCDAVSEQTHPSEMEGVVRLRQIPFWKRALDLSLVLVTCLIWLPLVVVIAGWIAVVSPGPIFYRQERIGFCRRRFRIFKFRTRKAGGGPWGHCW